jgi:hypothetical protein
VGSELCIRVRVLSIHLVGSSRTHGVVAWL